MLDFIFSDNSGNSIRVRTDGVDANTNNLTIMEVNDAPGGYYLLSNALQTAFGRNLNQAATTQQALLALGTSLNMNVDIIKVGGGPLKTPLAAPGSFVAATGSGAAGTLALTWVLAANANNVDIDRATNVGFTTGVQLAVYNGGASNFNDSGLTPATPYFYRIRSHDQNGIFPDSPFATATATSHA
jgi:hypothetical protein